MTSGEEIPEIPARAYGLMRTTIVSPGGSRISKLRNVIIDIWAHGPIRDLTQRAMGDVPFTATRKLVGRAEPRFTGAASKLDSCARDFRRGRDHSFGSVTAHRKIIRARS